MSPSVSRNRAAARSTSAGGGVSETNRRASLVEMNFAVAGRLALGNLPRVTFPVEKAADAFAAIRKPQTVLQAALAY